MSASNLQDLIDILRHVHSKISNDTDVIYAGFDSPEDLRADIENDLLEIEKGTTKILDKYKMWFAPAGPIQDISLSNNWEKEYLKLAKRFDELYKKVK
jgi:hypothetical protein